MFSPSIIILICSLIHCIRSQASTNDEELITIRDQSSLKTFDTADLKPDTVTFLELISDENYKDDVNVILKLIFLHLDSDNGDLFLIGKGRRSEVFNGPPCLMYVESHTESQNFHVMGKDVTMAFVARDISKTRRFQVQWNRNGTVTNIPLTTSVPTTPVSEADRRAVILCFRRKAVTCKEFHEPVNELLFKRRLADRSNKYTEEKKIDLPRRIISSDIKVRCLLISGSGKEVNSTRQNNFLIVSIADRRNPELPVFTTSQLSDIMKSFDTRAFDYDVAECRVYPNYWWWFWGSSFMLIIIIIMVLVFWKSSSNSFCHQPNYGVKDSVQKNKQMNGQVNYGYANEESFEKGETEFKSNNSLPSSSSTSRRLPSVPAIDIPDTDDLQLPANAFRPVMKNITLPPSEYGAQDMLFPSERERDSISMASAGDHIYEDPSYLADKAHPSPSLSLRKVCDDQDTSEL